MAEVIDSGNLRSLASAPFRRSDSPSEHKVSLTIITGFSVVFLVAGVQMTHRYVMVKWLFFFGWASFVLAAHIFLVVLSRGARVLWTGMSAIVSGLTVFAIYIAICPNLLISPQSLTFPSADTLYPVNIRNPSDTDKYACTFIIEISPEIYASNFFEFKIDKDSLKPLEQQLPENPGHPMSETFGMDGSNQSGGSIWILYIYHLAPLESRNVSIKFTGPQLWKAATVRFSIFSNSNRPLATKEIDKIIVIPVGMAQQLKLNGGFFCVTGQVSGEPCVYKTFASQGQLQRNACYYLGFVKLNQGMPESIKDPMTCNISDFDTW